MSRFNLGIASRGFCSLGVDLSRQWHQAEPTSQTVFNHTDRATSGAADKRPEQDQLPRVADGKADEHPNRRGRQTDPSLLSSQKVNRGLNVLNCYYGI